MDAIKNFLKEHQILPRISFKDRKEHTVQIMKARAESFNNDKDELVQGVKFLVTEGGEPKTFFTASQDLLTQLAESKEGETYKIKMYSESVGGVIKSRFSVKKVGETEEIPVPEEDPENNENVQ